MTVRDYLKCVWANQATLAGYSLIVGGILTITFGLSQDQFSSRSLLALLPSCGEIGVGSFLLWETDLGAHTLYAYQQTKNHIFRKGTIDSFWVYKTSLEYCDYTGTRLAARENGLEHLMKGLRREDASQSILGLDR